MLELFTSSTKKKNAFTSLFMVIIILSMFRWSTYILHKFYFERLKDDQLWLRHYSLFGFFSFYDFWIFNYISYFIQYYLVFTLVFVEWSLSLNFVIIWIKWSRWVLLIQITRSESLPSCYLYLHSIYNLHFIICCIRCCNCIDRCICCKVPKNSRHWAFFLSLIQYVWVRIRADFVAEVLPRQTPDLHYLNNHDPFWSIAPIFYFWWPE